MRNADHTPGDGLGPEFGIRCAAAADISRVVAIHSAAFPKAFLTVLGPAFLARYYASVLAYKGGILLVGTGKEGIAGLVAGVINPAGFYREMRIHRLRYLPSIVGGLIRSPRLADRVHANWRRVSREAATPPDVKLCELTSIAVAPEGQGQGLGRALVRRFLGCAWERHARAVYLDTDADDNEAANAFYVSLGFQRYRTFMRNGDRRMHEYRIEQPSWTAAPH